MIYRIKKSNMTMGKEYAKITGMDKILNFAKRAAFFFIISILLSGNPFKHNRNASAKSGNQLTMLEWQHPPIISHSDMAIEIGTPAIIRPGHNYPSLTVNPSSDGVLYINIVRKSGMDYNSDDPVVESFHSNVVTGQEIDITFEGSPVLGRYRIDLELIDSEKDKLLDTYFFTVMTPDEVPASGSVAVYSGNDDRLLYTPDYRGNRSPDFSHAGYMGGGVSLPIVDIMKTLEPQPGDDTKRIQDAIDELSKLPINENGFRGTLLLKKGVYEIDGSLLIRDSGIVIRGEGQGDFSDFWLEPQKGHSLEEFRNHISDKSATVLIATGQSMRTLISVQGSSGIVIDENNPREILNRYVPVGSNSFRIKDIKHIDLIAPGEGEMVPVQPEFEWRIRPSFEIGDRIIVERSGNMDWINEIKMNQIPPRPDGGRITQWSPFDLQFENIVEEIEGDRIWLKYPIMNAIEQQWGGGRIYACQDPGRINNIAIENLRAVSFWKPNEEGVDDTRHADRFLDFDNVKNAWVRNVTVEHFYSTNGSFSTGRGSKGITFKNSSTLVADRSYYAGTGYDSSGRTYGPTGVYVGRYGWRLQGQGALVIGAYAINSRHAYSLGARVTGPNVFFDAVAEQSLTWSEPHHRWAAGGLFDNIEESYGIALMNRLRYGSGHGWAAANFAAWNTSGGDLVTERPPTAQNWAIGHKGNRRNGPFHSWNMQNYGYSYGYWESLGSHVEPKSLFLNQLKDRLGQEALYNIGYQDF